MDGMHINVDYWMSIALFMGVSGWHVSLRLVGGMVCCWTIAAVLQRGFNIIIFYMNVITER